MEAFTEGLHSLSVGIQATLGACATAYYTHLDHALVKGDVGEIEGEPPTLSAAFLETLISEVQREQISALENCSASYFFFDNNDLKQVNTLGNYDCGTEVIRATGRWITRGIQTWSSGYHDSGSGPLETRLKQSPQSWVVRWGGDEFIAVVLGGPGHDEEWDKLMTCIRREIIDGRKALVRVVGDLPSLRKKKYNKKRLKDVVSRTSVSVGGAFVHSIGYLKEDGLKEKTAAFLRRGRMVAEDRMKLVKSLSKMDEAQVGMLLRDDESSGLKIKPFIDGLRWCYGTLAPQS